MSICHECSHSTYNIQGGCSMYSTETYDVFYTVLKTRWTADSIFITTLHALWLAVRLCVSTHYSRMQCRHHNSFAYHPSLQGCTHHDLHNARSQAPTLLNYHFHGWIRFTWPPRPQYRHTCHAWSVCLFQGRWGSSVTVRVVWSNGKVYVCMLSLELMIQN